MRTLGTIGIGLKRGTSKGGAKPLVDLDFSNMSTLPSSLTFTRSSLATMFNDAGVMVWCPHNLMLRSQEFDNASWTKRGTCTVTANAATAPDGTMTADLVQGMAGSLNDLFQTVALTVPSGTPYVPRVRIKRVSTTGTLSIENPGTTSSGKMTVDLSLLSDDWEDIKPGHPAVTVVNPFIVHTSGAVGIHFLRSSGSSELSFYVWGAQANLGTVADPYVVTTTAAYYGPRFGRALPGRPRGIIVEPGRTNLLVWSQDQTNANWVKVRCSVLGSVAIAPDLTVTMNKVVEDSSASTDHYLQQSPSKAASAITYTYSVFLKAAERPSAYLVSYGSSFANRAEMTVSLTAGTVTTAAAAFGSYASASGGIESVGNGIYWVWMTYTTDTHTAQSCRVGLHNGSSGGYTGDGASGIYMWGAQLEAADTASSYIPTTGATTRGGDSLRILSLSGLLGSTTATGLQDHGAAAMEYSYSYRGSTSNPSGRYSLSFDDGTNNHRILVYNNPQTSLRVTTGGSTAAMPADTTIIAPWAVSKYAIRWAMDNIAISVDARTAIVVTSTPAGMPLITGLGIGCHVTSGQVHGVVHRLRIYTHAAADAELKSLSS